MREAVERLEASLGESHADTLEAMRLLGKIYVGMGRLEEAEETYSRALESAHAAHGENAPDTRKAEAALEELRSRAEERR